MVHRFVLIDTIDVESSRIESALKKHPNITDVQHSVIEETAMAEPTFDNFNIIIKIEADSYDRINEIIKTEIQPIQGIKDIRIYAKPTLYG